MLYSVTNKFIPERSSASDFSKQMHKGLVPAAATRCLLAALFSQRDTVSLSVSPLGILCRSDTVYDHYDDPTLASAFAGALRFASPLSLPIGQSDPREPQIDGRELSWGTRKIAWGKAFVMK